MKIIFLASLFLMSCGVAIEGKPKSDPVSARMAVRTIDSCEYILAEYNGISIIHKANCKFCKERSKK